MITIKKTFLGVACALWAVGVGTFVNAQETTVLEHMHEHYDAVVKIQRAVIAGSLEGVRDPARWLLEHEAPAGLPAGWEEHVDALRAAAREALDSPDVAAAASATSRLGLACGGCHVANNVSVEFDEVDRPSDDENPTAHMQRHQWAADRMWEGLIGPSEMSWGRGANLLFESPIRPDAVHDDAGDAAWLGMARRIHQLAANATMVWEPAEMAAIYAEFLANCAACHNALGDGPNR